MVSKKFFGILIATLGAYAYSVAAICSRRILLTNCWFRAKTNDVSRNILHQTQETIYYEDCYAKKGQVIKDLRFNGIVGPLKTVIAKTLSP